MSDPIRDLQRAALRCALSLSSKSHPAQVEIRDEDGRVLVSVVVPSDPDVALPSVGWAFSGTEATYEGKPVPISPARIGLIRILCESTEPVSCELLADKGWAPNHSRTGQDNIRRHIGLLREEIKAGVNKLDFDPIEATGHGYLLKLR